MSDTPRDVRDRLGEAVADMYVRTVLRAIRVPDERVIEQMAAALVRPTLLMGGSSPLAKRQALAIWQAGIDAMMEDGK